MRSEIGEERPFQCNVCEYSFSYKGEKAFHCNVSESNCYYDIFCLSQYIVRKCSLSPPVAVS